MTGEEGLSNRSDTGLSIVNAIGNTADTLRAGGVTRMFLISTVILNY